MAFIKEEERKSLIGKINESYAFRKILIAIEIAALLGFIIVVFLQGVGILQLTYKDGENLSGFGIGMLIWGIVIAILGIIALILTFTIKSPKKVKAQMDKLQSSALSGKRVFKTSTSQETNRSRTTIKNKKK